MLEQLLIDLSWSSSRLEGNRYTLLDTEKLFRSGAAATDILSAGPVRCTRVSTDRYGRTVARCRAGRRDVNREMVRRGMAWAYRQYGDDYVGEEKAAKKARVGIWKYTSQPAWEYRANKRK